MSEVISAIPSANVTDIHTPSSGSWKSIGRKMTAKAWKTKVRKKEISAEVSPSLSAVKNAEK